jgi:Flp pilus assembly protein TadG
MKRGRSGNAVLEVALWMPVLLLLISGAIQFGKLTYLDYVLNKIVYNAARNVATAQNLNLCDPADLTLTNAITAAINDPATGQPLIANLTSDMLVVTTRCADSTGALAICVPSCQGVQVPQQRPDYVTVAIADPGYSVQLRIPYINPIPVSLHPSATAPFAGSAL